MVRFVVEDDFWQLFPNALIGVVAVAIVAGTWLSRRARLINALRVGED